MESPQERNRLGVELFGKSFATIAPAVAAGYTEMAAAATVSSDAQIRAIEQASEAWDRFYLKQTTNVTSWLGNAVIAGTAVQNLTNEQAKHLFELERAGDAAGASKFLLNLHKQVDIMLPAQAALNKETKNYTKELADAKKEVDDLTVTQRAGISAAKQLGASTEDITRDFNVSTGALKVLEQQTKAQEAATKKAKDENKKATEVLEEAIKAEKKSAAALDEMGWKTRDVTARMSELAQVGRQQTIPMITDMATAAETYGQKVTTGTDASKSLRDMFDELKDHAPGMREEVRKAGEEIDNSITHKISGNVRDALSQMPQMFIDAFTGGGGVMGALKGIGVSLLNAILQDILAPVWKAVGDWAGGIAGQISGAFSGARGGPAGLPSLGGIVGSIGGIVAGGIIGAMGGMFINDLIDGSTGTTAPSGWINGAYVEPTNSMKST